MKYYSSASVVITTLRKAGHYPSTRVAQFLARRFAFLFEEESMPSSVSIIADYLRGDRLGWERCAKHFTPSEFQILFEFGVWWARENGETHSDCTDLVQAEDDIIGDMRGHANDKAYVAINLNRGRMLTVLSR